MNISRAEKLNDRSVDGKCNGRWKTTPSTLVKNVAATACNNDRKRRISDILCGDPSQSVMSSDEKCKLFLALARPEESHRLASPDPARSFGSMYNQSVCNRRRLPNSMKEKNSTDFLRAPVITAAAAPISSLNYKLINNNFPQTTLKLPKKTECIESDVVDRQSRDCVVAFTENGPIRVTAGSMPPGLLHQFAPPRNAGQAKPHPLHARLAQQQVRMREARRLADRPPTIVTQAEIDLFNDMVKVNTNPNNLPRTPAINATRLAIQTALEQPLTKIPVGLNTPKIIEQAVDDCFVASFALYKKHVDLTARKLDLMSKCIVCYQEFSETDEIAMLPCVPSHIVHASCLRQWLKQKLQCPFCRADFPSAKANTIAQGLGIA